MAFGSKKGKSSRIAVWPVSLFGVVVVIAIGLRIYQFFTPSNPNVQVPSATYMQVMQQLEEERLAKEAADALADEVPANGEGDDGTGTKEVPVAEPIAEEPKELPAEFNLAVPFTSQAPNSNWDALHEDACEEASWLMVREYYAGNSEPRLAPEKADPELIAMVESQTAQGLEPSVTANELVTWMAGYDNVTARIIENPTIEQMKRLLVEEGKPIIVPMAGRELGNPYFSGEGPIYHMLVIRGYTADGFITNEPGTRMGENYFYSYDVVMEAMGDWEGKDPANGAKRIIVVEP